MTELPAPMSRDEDAERLGLALEMASRRFGVSIDDMLAGGSVRGDVKRARDLAFWLANVALRVRSTRIAKLVDRHITTIGDVIADFEDERGDDAFNEGYSAALADLFAYLTAPSNGSQYRTTS